MKTTVTQFCLECDFDPNAQSLDFIYEIKQMSTIRNISDFSLLETLAEFTKYVYNKKKRFYSSLTCFDASETKTTLYSVI